MSFYLTPPSTAANVQSGTTTQEGTVRLATIAEAGTNSETLAVTPAGLQSELSSAISGGVTYRSTVAVNDISTTLANGIVGDMYKVSTSGTAHGYDWSIGDTIIVNADMGGTFDVAKINRLDTTDSDLATVATTGSYNDLLNQPNIPSASTDLTDSADLVRTADLSPYLTDITSEDVGDLSDVVISNPQPDDVLVYDNVNNRWINSAQSGTGGYPIEGATGTSHTAGVNKAVYFTKASGTAVTLELPLSTNLNDGDMVFAVRQHAGSLTIKVNTDPSETATLDYLDSIGNSSYTFTNNQQEMVIRFYASFSKWYIFEKAQHAVAISGDYGDLSNVPTSSDSFTGNHTATNYTAANTDTITTHLAGIDTELGTLNAGLTPSLDDVTTNGNTTTNAINVGTITTSGDIMPDADATRTLGDENTRFISYYGDMNGAIRFKAKNLQGVAINKGQAVYISGHSGTVPEVKLAQANSSTTMPAFGLALTSANANADVEIVSFGNLVDYNTTTYSLSANDTVYVSAATAGALTSSVPTSEANLIQNIGRVVRADASAGIIKVGGAGRSAATPNLDNGNIFIGNASNQSVTATLANVAVTSLNGLRGVITLTGDDILGDHSPTHYTQANPNVDGHLSGIDSKFGTLGSSSTLDTTITGGLADAGKVVITDAQGKLGAIDGSNLNGVLIETNNLSDLTSASSARTNLGLGSSAVEPVGTFAQVANDLSDLNDAPTARTNLGLGGSATLDTTIAGGGADAGKVVITDANGKLGALDGSNLTNLPSASSGFPVQTATTSVNPANLNSAVYFTTGSANTTTATLPLASTASDGDVVIIVRQNPGTLVINQNASEPLSGGNVVNKLNYFGSNSTTHTITNNQQQIHIRFDSAGNSGAGQWYIYDKAQALVATSGDIADLSNVTISSVQPNDVLKYDSGTASWVNGTISGGGGFTYSAVTNANTPVTAQAQYHYSCTNTLVINLPASSGVTAGNEIRVKNMGTGTITINANGTDKIDGTASASITMSVQYQMLGFVSNGVDGWEIV